jgi:hypothetical protein
MSAMDDLTNSSPIQYRRLTGSAGVFAAAIAAVESAMLVSACVSDILFLIQRWMNGRGWRRNCLVYCLLLLKIFKKTFLRLRGWVWVSSLLDDRCWWDGTGGACCLRCGGGGDDIPLRYTVMILDDTNVQTVLRVRNEQHT